MEGKIMKYLIAPFMILVFSFFGCNKRGNGNPVNPENDTNSPQYSIKITDYSKSNYFIDAIYSDTSSSLDMFHKYYGEIIPVVIPRYMVTNIEVYTSTDEFNAQTDIKGNAYINLPARNGENLYSEHYRDSLAQDTIGKYYSGNFRRLMESTFYTFNDYTGWLSLSSVPKESQIIAVSYTIQGDQNNSPNGITYGEYTAEIVNYQKDRIVLKLVKPPYLKPSMSEAWKLQLKNIYRVKEYYGAFKKINLDIYYAENRNTLINKIDNKGFLNLFGFDNFSEDWTPNPDGKFDYKIGIDILPATMKIIFPNLEPFGANLPSVLPDSLRRMDIYTQPKSSLDTLKNSFILRGNFIYQ